jgi:hypothetical protein
MKKNRPPLKQLKESAKIADEMLRQKGILAKDSFIDKIIDDPKAPTLPGLPAYLPHEETIAACQILLARTTKLWIEQNKQEDSKTENIADFFRFVLKRIKREEDKFTKEHKQMDKKIKKDYGDYILSDIFSPLRKRQTARALYKFFVDSFAVSHIVKRKSCTSEYVDWFLNEWTPSMIGLWHKSNDIKECEEKLEKPNNK